MNTSTVGGAFDCRYGAQPDIRFNDIWTNGSIGDCVTGEGNILENPLFCASPAGDYTLQGCSPCVGAGEGGSTMGAHDVGCECVTSTEALSWGAIKAMYR